MKFLPALTFLLLITNVVTLFFLISGSSGNASGTYKRSCCVGNCYSANCDTSVRFPFALADSMVRNYRINHWKYINANCPQFNNPKTNGISQDSSDALNDARTAWESLDTLKKFIHTIETLTCSNNPNSNPYPQLGIRFYYAEYPMDTNYLKKNNVPTQYAGFHTLLMIPTYNNGTYDLDFDPSIAISGFSFNIDTSTITALIPSVSAANHMGLAPPPPLCDIYWTEGPSFMQFVDILDGFSTASVMPKGAGCPPTGH